MSEMKVMEIKCPDQTAQISRSIQTWKPYLTSSNAGFCPLAQIASFSLCMFYAFKKKLYVEQLSRVEKILEAKKPSF